MNPTQHLIHELAPNVNPAGAEAHIRHDRKILAAGSTLEHLTRDELLSGAREASKEEDEQPGSLAHLAISLGLIQDYRIWDALLFRTSPPRRKNQQTPP